MEYFFRMLSATPRTAFAVNALTLYRIDAPNKLSHDAGRAKRQREEDWGACLESIIDVYRKHGVNMDPTTRLIFLASLRKHLRYLMENPDCSDQLIRGLSHEIEKTPSMLLELTELWLRLQERCRLFSTGFRWMRGYQCSPPTLHQLELIRELGFETAFNSTVS
jgi:hypothetical protein